MFQYISIYSPLLPILVFLFLPFNWKERLKWVIFLLLIVSVSVDIFATEESRRSIDTLWLANIYTIFETLMVLLFSFFLFHQFKAIKLGISIVAVGFTLFWVFKNLINHKLAGFDVVSQSLESLFLFIICIFYFFKSFSIKSDMFIYNTFEFWIIAALLMYGAGTFFGFLIPISTSTRSEDVIVFEYLLWIGNTLKSVFIAIAFCINNKPMLSNTNNLKNQYYFND